MDILYSCTDFTVCVKPTDIDSEAGMPQALSSALGGEFFPVHRLDANVGGIMVYARNKNAAPLQREKRKKNMWPLCTARRLPLAK